MRVNTTVTELSLRNGGRGGLADKLAPTKRSLSTTQTVQPNHPARPSGEAPTGKNGTGEEQIVKGARAQRDVRYATRRNAVQIGNRRWAGLASVRIAILPRVGGRWAFGEEAGDSEVRRAPGWVRDWVLAFDPWESARSEAPYLTPAADHPGDKLCPRRGVGQSAFGGRAQPRVFPAVHLGLPSEFRVGSGFPGSEGGLDHSSIILDSQTDFDLLPLAFVLGFTCCRAASPGLNINSQSVFQSVFWSSQTCF